MRAALYKTTGKAADVLAVEDLPTPMPGAGEVRVKLAFSGVNPSDVKSRSGASARGWNFPFIVPHSDGAGTIDAVGAGVDANRVGERVWVYNGQWERAMGTAAEAIVLPAAQAVPLPANVSFEQGASIAIPLMTAFHAVAACGSLIGRTVIVPGAAGSVGFYATQLVKLAGARVIALVSSPAKAAIATGAGAHACVNYREEDVSARIKSLTDGRGADQMRAGELVAHLADAAMRQALARLVDARGQAQIGGHIVDMPEVVACHLVSGEADYFIEVVLPELEDYQRFLVGKLLSLPIVREVRSNIAIQTLKAGAPLPLTHLQ